MGAAAQMVGERRGQSGGWRRERGKSSVLRPPEELPFIRPPRSAQLCQRLQATHHLLQSVFSPQNKIESLLSRLPVRAGKHFLNNSLADHRLLPKISPSPPPLKATTLRRGRPLRISSLLKKDGTPNHPGSSGTANPASPHLGTAVRQVNTRDPSPDAARYPTSLTRSPAQPLPVPRELPQNYSTQGPPRQREIPFLRAVRTPFVFQFPPASSALDVPLSTLGNRVETELTVLRCCSPAFTLLKAIYNQCARRLRLFHFLRRQPEGCHETR